MKILDGVSSNTTTRPVFYFILSCTFSTCAGFMRRTFPLNVGRTAAARRRFARSERPMAFALQELNVPVQHLTLPPRPPPPLAWPGRGVSQMRFLSRRISRPALASATRPAPNAPLASRLPQDMAYIRLSGHSTRRTNPARDGTKQSEPNTTTSGPTRPSRPLQITSRQTFPPPPPPVNPSVLARLMIAALPTSHLLSAEQNDWQKQNTLSIPRAQ